MIETHRNIIQFHARFIIVNLRAAQKICYKLFGAETELEIGTPRRRRKIFIKWMTSFEASDCKSRISVEPESCLQLFFPYIFVTISENSINDSCMESIFIYRSFLRKSFSGKQKNLHPRVINMKIVLLSAMMKKNFTRNFCVQSVSTQCLWRRKLCISISWRLVRFFSGRKFSSSSLLKILFGLRFFFLFRLQIAFIVTGTVRNAWNIFSLIKNNEFQYWVLVLMTEGKLLRWLSTWLTAIGWKTLLVALHGNEIHFPSIEVWMELSCFGNKKKVEHFWVIWLFLPFDEGWSI